MDPHHLPAVNATLNGTAGLLLFLGWRAIKAKNQKLHQNLMLAAMCTSALFLCSYLTYHFMVPGVTKYQGQGILRPIYFTILLTHTPLAMVIVPFSLMSLRYALRKEFVKHVKITRWLLPVWMYVSVTGVVIYLMLYVFKPA